MTRQVTIVCYHDSITGKAKSDPQGVASAAILTHSLPVRVKIANQLSIGDSGLSCILPRSRRFCIGVCLSICVGVLEFCPNPQKAIPNHPLLEVNINKLIIKFTCLFVFIARGRNRFSTQLNNFQLCKKVKGDVNEYRVTLL